jgi:uncharacterized SAM-binding protein YcdF (DUF218 family)
MDAVLVIKIISALVYPMGLFFLLLLFALLFRLFGKIRSGILLLLAAVLILFIASNPLVASKLVATLENRYPQQEMRNIEPHQAILVLGGGLRIPLPPAQDTQLTSGSDRYWHAANLFKGGKAEMVFLAGGNVFAQQGFQGEAFYASQLLQQWGIPASAIQVESTSRNTEQNRAHIETWLKSHNITRVLLVTSGYHMPRALETFSDSSVTYVPAAADILIREGTGPAVFNWLPSSSALNMTTLALHEYYGIWFLRLKRRFAG